MGYIKENSRVKKDTVMVIFYLVIY
ncbi:hypothetical protein [Candidatus Williamhamiltonella defendens]|nr:hypothetical protein [Candidatus Hamiltonella defensa]